MKKSEAIKIISDIIETVTYDNIAKKRAVTILEELEKAGMRPPGREWGNYFVSNSWEPENE